LPSRFSRCGSNVIRRVEDLDSVALTYGEVKAIASGNPLVMAKAQVDAGLMRFTRPLSAHAEERATELDTDIAETAVNPRRVFDAAQQTPCALVLDECDTIARNFQVFDPLNFLAACPP